MSPARVPVFSRRWRGKACRIFTFDDSARLESIGGKPETYFLDGLSVTAPDGRYGYAQGCGKGLEQNRDALSGRCIMARAISLAVHLGASEVFLAPGDPVDPRARRNLETLVRPLKSRHVRIYAPESLGTPFPKSEP